MTEPGGEIQGSSAELGRGLVEYGKALMLSAMEAAR
jgi:hypothetical protein